MGTIRRQKTPPRSKNSRLFVIASGVFCIGTFTLFPILLLQSYSSHSTVIPMSVDHTVMRGGGISKVDASGAVVVVNKEDSKVKGEAKLQPESTITTNSATSGVNNSSKSTATRKTKDGRILPNIQVSELSTDEGIDRSKIGRGVSAVQTPSQYLADAKRAHIECDINVDSLAYWNVGEEKPETNPFQSEGYITFAPDRGGWNNVRMSMEIIFVIAAATGRTLVLPPREPMYLLHLDKGSRYRGFADFFPIHTAAFQSRVKVITFEEFLETEMAPKDDPDLLATLQASAHHCEKRAKSDTPCTPVFDWMKAASYNSDISATHTCLVFDEEAYGNSEMKASDNIQEVCGSHREITFWNAEMAQHKWIHFRASEKEYRLLTHYYNIIHFSNPIFDNMYKRFVRDALHYHDAIYCAAGKIVKAVQAEGRARGFELDENGAGGYSALHVRRGDLQYKRVKIPASEWYENTKEIWKPKEILYVATDERNKTFFDDILKHHDLRYLDDYWDMAGLAELDPNYMGMIDTVVASRGRAYAGTWFSTFSGYINRLRGYHGLSMMDSWYSFLPKKTAVHEWPIVDDFAYAYEWPDGWVGIDGDEVPTRDVF